MMNNTNLYDFVLWLGDTALISGHRMSEWSSKGPMLEEDIAMTNMALDLIGHAELLLNYAGTLEGKGRTADDLAYRRPERQFHNALISELPNGDFAHTMVRQYFLAAFQDRLYSTLMHSPDEPLAAIARKVHKEVAYHLRHTHSWLQRLGDGTEESKRLTQQAVSAIWPYTGELFEMTAGDRSLREAQIIPDLWALQSLWMELVSDALKTANLSAPEGGYMHNGGRKGIHTEYLGYILAQMQYLPRAYPDANW